MNIFENVIFKMVILKIVNIDSAICIYCKAKYKKHVNVWTLSSYFGHVPQNYRNNNRITHYYSSFIYTNSRSF